MSERPLQLPSLRALAGLEDAGVLNPLGWTERYRRIRGARMRIPGPLRDIYLDLAPEVAIMKGAQLGLSEYAINLSVWTADTGRGERGNALFVQPTGEMMRDFTQARLMPALEESDYLTGRLGQPENTGLMRVDRGHVYCRASGSRAGLKSVGADTVILDEFDEMAQDVFELAAHRLDSSLAPLMRLISTPNYPGGPIETAYLAGDQRRFLLQCPACGFEQPLDWETNVVDCVRVCRRCRSSLEDIIRKAWAGQCGRWVPQQPGRARHSYHLSQLYRPDVDLAHMTDALNSADLARRTEAYNQYLAVPFAQPGDQLSLEELQRASRAPFDRAGIAGVGPCWMGVDIGTHQHCWIGQNRLDEHGQWQSYAVGLYEVESIREVADLMRRFAVRVCVSWTRSLS